MPTSMNKQQSDTERASMTTGAIVCALFAALARLGVVAAIGAWLVILLLNEVATALVYVIAAVLALFVVAG